jgi:hypothetical protein
MIGVQCALVILNPYFLGTQLEGIAGDALTPQNWIVFG